MEAYRVGVTFALNNLVSGALAQIARQFTSTNKAAKELHGTLLSLSKIAVIETGIAVVGVIRTAIDDAREFQTEVARFSAMGFGDAATLQAEKFAKSMDVVGISYTDAMKLIREATAVTGDPMAGMQMAATAAKAESAMSGYLGAEKAAQASRMMMDMFKTTELRGDIFDQNGVFQADKVRSDLDAEIKVLISTGGLVTPEQLYNFIKTGGVAAKGLSAEAFYFQESHQMQETGGLRAGTSLMSNYQNLAMGRASQAVLSQLMDMGLLNSDMVEMNKHTGKPARMKPGALKDAMDFMNSQFEWFEKNIEPQLAGLSRDKAIEKISSLSSNRTAMNRDVAFYLEHENIEKAVRLGHQANGVDNLYGSEAQTNLQKYNDLTAKYKDLMIELGAVALPTVNKAIQFFIDILKPLTVLASGSQPLGESIWNYIKYGVLNKNANMNREIVADRAAHGLDGQSASTAVTPPPFQRTNQPIVVQSILDGRVIAESTSSYFNDYLNSTSSVSNSTRAFDGRMSLQPSGL